MLTAIHFLLSYKCDSQCDHCFVYSGPQARGTFTLGQLEHALDQAAALGTVKMVYFEGGEPFLFYPLMLEGIRMARGLGFKTGVVTNAYWAVSAEDAELWLRPLQDLEVSDISISDDQFHYQGQEVSPARHALSAAQALGLPYGSISIDQPRAEAGMDKDQTRGAPVIAGGVMFRGRAVDKLTLGLPLRPWQDFTECPYEDLAAPKRVHLDSYGNVHLCQGLSLGSIWEVPLLRLVRDYRPDVHPVCRPLLQGGPARLVEEYGIGHQDGYVDACHLCYLARRALLDRFPRYLAPRQVYGLD